MDRRNRSAWIGVLAMTVASVAWAQDAEKPLLQGPKVVESKIPGTQESFTMTGQRLMRDRIPPRVIEAALRTLMADDAPEHVRISPEQAEQIRQIEADVREAVRAYTESHAPEVRRLTRIAESGRNRAMSDATESQPSEADIERARARLTEIRAAAPGPADAHARIWRVLNETQRSFMEAELARFRAEMDARMTEAIVERRMRQQQNAGERPAQAETPQRRRLAQELDFLPEELRMRIAALPPEQRDRLLARLRERHAQAQREQAEQRREDQRRPAEVQNRPSRPN